MLLLLRLAALSGVFAACSTYSGPPCERLRAVDPLSTETRRCLIEHYPATLPPCARSLSVLSVDEALSDSHRGGEMVAVRGHLAELTRRCTYRGCGPGGCCNGCDVSFSLVGASKRGLVLDSWKEAPPLLSKCDFSVNRSWRSQLTIVASGLLADLPMDPPADPLASPPVPTRRRILTVVQTCRAE